MVDWKVTKKEPVCAHCAHPFEDGEALISVLAVRDETLSREDACLACWKARGERDALIWWRTRHDTTRKRGLALDLEALEALFVRLEGRAELGLAELRYVLCLILMRKRRLKVERVEREGEREAMVVVRPRRAETFRVAVFDFTPDRIEQLQSRLREVLEGNEGEGSPNASQTAAAEPAEALAPGLESQS